MPHWPSPSETMVSPAFPATSIWDGVFSSDRSSCSHDAPLYVRRHFVFVFAFFKCNTISLFVYIYLLLHRITKLIYSLYWKTLFLKVLSLSLSLYLSLCMPLSLSLTSPDEPRCCPLSNHVWYVDWDDGKMDVLMMIGLVSPGGGEQSDCKVDKSDKCATLPRHLIGLISGIMNHKWCWKMLFSWRSTLKLMQLQRSCLGSSTLSAL